MSEQNLRRERGQRALAGMFFGLAMICTFFLGLTVHALRVLPAEHPAMFDWYALGSVSGIVVVVSVWKCVKLLLR